MEYRCSCGRVLRVPDGMAGKKGKCPGCGKIFDLPAGPGPQPGSKPAQARPPAAADSQGAGGKITLKCSCGRSLSVPASAAGKQVKCPACGSAVPVPAASSPAPDEEEFELEVPAAARVSAGDTSGFGYASAHCPNCGSEIQRGAIFCVECGTHLGSGKRVETMVEAPAPAPSGRRRRGSGRLGTLVGLILLIILVAGAVAAFTVFRGKLRPLIGRFLPRATSRSQGGASEGKAEAERGSYLATVVRAPGQARETTALLSIQQAIESFKAMHERPPRDLEELKADIGTLPEAPPGMEFVYDPSSGRVDVRRAEAAK